MTPALFITTAITPGAALAVQHDLDSPEARLLLMAIAGQESGWSAREQKPVAYARSYWQMEIEAVQQAFEGADTGPVIRSVCTALDMPADAEMVYHVIACHDPLAYMAARLTLLPDPAPLPAVGDEAGAWNYYLRVWRPGKPDESRWSGRYQTAMSALGLK